MRTIFIVAFITTFFTTCSYADNKSIYTSTNSKNCKIIKNDPNEAGSDEAECQGVGGYKVHLLEGDLRQTLNIITPRNKTFELNFWGFYGGFSTVGDKIEWRINKGIPVALIVRYNVENSDNSKKKRSYLMISKISKDSSCVTNVVPPKANQNLQARKLADVVITQPCKIPGNK